MVDELTLMDYVDGLDVPTPMNRDWLLADFLRPLGIAADGDVSQGCEDVVLAGAGFADGSLHIRPGGWRINLAGSAIRTLLAGSLVAAALAVGGFDDIPIEVIPATLPLLVDVKRIRLDRRDRSLLLPLRGAAAGLEGQAIHPQILYDRLDPAVRRQLNYLDFVAFCERLIAAAEMDDGGFDEIKPRAPGSLAWIRVTLD